MRKPLSILLVIVAILFGASGDGLNDSGVKTWGHLLEALEILSVMWLFMAFKAFTLRSGLLVLLGYVFLRVGLYDYSYNISRGLELFYVGAYNWWDLLLSKQPPGGS